jgi:hypothetical protein
MHANVYTRGRKHIGTKWSRVTCLALPLAAAQSLGSQVLEDSQSHCRQMIVIGNKQLKQINKQYIKQYLNSNQLYRIVIIKSLGCFLIKLRNGPNCNYKKFRGVFTKF